MKLADLQTPCLLLDEQRMDRNIARLQQQLRRLGVPLRPHLKTAKCIEVARRLMPTAAGPATVSTLREAEQFAAAGVRDVLYAVGITPAKLPRVLGLRKSGIDVAVILDTPDQARAVAAASREAGERIPALIEIDADDHRAGLRPGDATLIEVGRILHEAAQLRGVMTHAGGSYDRPGAEAFVAAAEQERAAVVSSAEALRRAGLPSPVVSVGSTPTALFARDLTGVTEVRAGVFVFQDLVMSGLGVCGIDDIAISVLGAVIGHQREKGWILTDAGWTAMSRDRGTARQAVDQGYGVVCDIAGRPYDDLVMTSTNQEHGIVAIRSGSKAKLPDLPVGSLLRILPNHACATAGQHDRYHVIGGNGIAGRDSTSRTVTAADDVAAVWPRFSGW